MGPAMSEVVAESEAPEVAEGAELRPYFALTVSNEAVARGIFLDRAVVDAEAALEAARGALARCHARLVQLEQDAVFRGQRREALTGQREQHAVAANVEGTANAEAMLLALDRVDRVQADIAAKERAHRDQLAARVTAADDAVAAARAEVDRFRRETQGKTARFIVDWVCHSQVKAWMASEMLDAIELAKRAQALPDAAAQIVAADPQRYIRAFQESLKPKEKPRKTKAQLLSELKEITEELERIRRAEDAKAVARVAPGASATNPTSHWRESL